MDPDHAGGVADEEPDVAQPFSRARDDDPRHDRLTIGNAVAVDLLGRQSTIASMASPIDASHAVRARCQGRRTMSSPEMFT